VKKRDALNFASGVPVSVPDVYAISFGSSLRVAVVPANQLSHTSTISLLIHLNPLSLPRIRGNPTWDRQATSTIVKQDYSKKQPAGTQVNILHYEQD
jgi:hypothetical protein